MPITSSGSAERAPGSSRAATALDRLADEYVDLSVRLDPYLATSLGVPGHDAEATDYSPAAVAERPRPNPLSARRPPLIHRKNMVAGQLAACIFCALRHNR